MPFDGSKFAGSAPCSSLIIVLRDFFWTAWRSYVNSMIEEIIVSCDGSGGSASIGDEESSQYSGLIAWGGVVGTLLLLLALRRLKRFFYVS